MDCDTYQARVVSVPAPALPPSVLCLALFYCQVQPLHYRLRESCAIIHTHEIVCAVHRSMGSCRINGGVVFLVRVKHYLKSLFGGSDIFFQRQLFQ